MSESTTESVPARDGAPSTADAAERVTRRLRRIAGWGGVAAFVAWAGQPVVVAISAAGDAPEYPDYRVWVADRAFLGGIEAAIFAGVGVGLLFLVLGTWGLIRGSGHGESVASRVGLVCGIVGSAAWLLAAGAAFAPFTSVGAGLPEVAPDPALQAALIQTLNIAMTSDLMVFAVGMTGWALLIATTGRRAGIVGLPLTVVALAAVASAVATFALPFQPPWGMIGLLLFALVLGVRMLVTSRTA